MSKRRRIFLAALAVGAVAGMIVWALAEGGERSPLKLSFTPSVTTNDTARVFSVRVTNDDSCPVFLISTSFDFDGRKAIQDAGFFLELTEVAQGQVFSNSLEVPTSSFSSVASVRWRVRCDVIRGTGSNNLRSRLRSLPFVRRMVEEPARESVTSETFGLQP